MTTTAPGQGLRIKRLLSNFSVRASLAGIEPVGFRVKSDSRNHQAIVQPRLYDCSMVTLITLNTEPHAGFDSCQGHSTEKLPKVSGT